MKYAGIDLVNVVQFFQICDNFGLMHSVPSSISGVVDSPVSSIFL